MNAFIAYFFLGISLSAPIGPINAAQLDRGAKYGFWHAGAVGLGAICADVLFMLLIYFGFAHFLNTEFMKTFLWLFGCFVLLYTGLDTMKSSAQLAAMDTRNAQSIMQSFQSGFMMAISNPLSILFWIGIYGSILAESIMNQSGHVVLWNTMAIFTGLLIWDVIMASIASTFHSFGNEKTIRTISLVSGISLILFGFYFGYQGVQLLLG